MEVLESRAGYLKSIGRSLQGAMFSHQTSTHLSTPPMQLKASWQEILSFFDGSKKTNNKDMTITLQQSGNDWIIVKVE